MKRTLKRITSIALCLALVLSFGIESFAAGNVAETTVKGYSDNDEIYEVIDNNTPVRSGPSQDDSVICRIDSGALVIVTKRVTTIRFTNWAKVKMNNGSDAYIYMEHLSKHTCHPMEMRFGEGESEIVFEVCDCGKTRIKTWNTTALGKAKEVVGGIVTGIGAMGVYVAITAATAGLPVIVGFGGIIVAAAGISLFMDGLNDKKLSDVPLDKLIENSAGYCYSDSIHLVTYYNGGLHDSMKNNNSCVDDDIAYIYAYCGGLCWVNSQASAERVATLAGSTWSTTINGYNAYAVGDGYILYGGNSPC